MNKLGLDLCKNIIVLIRIHGAARGSRQLTGAMDRSRPRAGDFWPERVRRVVINVAPVF